MIIKIFTVTILSVFAFFSVSGAAPMSTLRVNSSLRPLSILEKTATTKDAVPSLAETEDEMLDILYEDGRPTGQKVRRDIAHRDGILHGGAGFIVIDWDIDPKTNAPILYVWLQERSRFKGAFPGCLFAVMGGHAKAGQDPVVVAVAEGGEELTALVPQVIITADNLTPLAEGYRFSGFFQKYEIGGVAYYLFISHDASGNERVVLTDSGKGKPEALQALRDELASATGETVKEKIANFAATHQGQLKQQNREIKAISVRVLTPQEKEAVNLADLNQKLKEEADEAERRIRS